MLSISRLNFDWSKARAEKPVRIVWVEGDKLEATGINILIRIIAVVIQSVFLFKNILKLKKIIFNINTSK